MSKMRYILEISKEDFIKFNMHQMEHNRIGRKNILYSRLLLPTISIVVVIVMILLKVERQFIAWTAGTLAVASILWMINILKIMERSVRANVDRAAAKGKKFYAENEEITFNEDGVYDFSDEGSFELPYDQVLNAVFVDDAVYLYIDPMKALIVPYRCLGKDKDRVVNLLKSKIERIGDRDEMEKA
ncbi:MAG: YcxB family protein [Eubacteriales bacterium]|nr:YcxB family protein [Eubacteriales bacterium]